MMSWSATRSNALWVFFSLRATRLNAFKSGLGNRKVTDTKAGVFFIVATLQQLLSACQIKKQYILTVQYKAAIVRLMDPKDCVQYLNHQPSPREEQMRAQLRKCERALADAAMDFSGAKLEGPRKRCSDLWMETMHFINGLDL